MMVVSCSTEFKLRAYVHILLCVASEKRKGSGYRILLDGTERFATLGLFVESYCGGYTVERKKVYG
jgi:hypothetical protein